MRSRAGGGSRKMRGLLVGIVTQIADPLSQGRVKVKFPTLADDVESNWARVIGFYAGASRGTMFVPEKGDEVMVAFDGGDPNHPYVIGAVWNGKHAVPGPGNSDGKNDHKWFRSRSGHDLELLDTEGGEKIRLVDKSQKNSMVFDTAADTLTTQATSGSISLSAPAGLIQIDCVDLKITTSKDRGLVVGQGHTIKVGVDRKVGVSKGSYNEAVGSSYSVSSPKVSTDAKSHTAVSAGAVNVNQGQLKASVKNTLELAQSAAVTRTVGQQKTDTGFYASVASDGGPSGVLTLTAGQLILQGDKAVYLKASAVTVMAGMLNVKASSILVAKDIKGGKAPLATFMGGLLLLNPGGITFPTAKMLDLIVGFDLHGPTTPVPPAPPIPVLPMPFMGPIVLSVQPTVLVNFMPAAGSGAIAIGFHPPPLPFMWIPMTFGAIMKSAILALVTAPFTALLELARGQLSALAAGSTNPVIKNGFVQGFLGQAPAGDAGTDLSISRFFPMFGSPQAFLGFIAQCMPLPVANGQTTIASPTVSACDSPLSLAMPMGGNSCSNIPVVPNASVIGFSNVLTGMSLSQLMGIMAWNALSAAVGEGVKAGTKAIGNAAAGRIQRSNNPTLRNAAQKTSDFLGNNHCIAEGHPIDPVSGTLFDSVLDFELPGPQPFEWVRFYSSRSVKLPGDASELGPGWRHCWDELLIADTDDTGTRTVALRTFEGRVLGFVLPNVDGNRDFNAIERTTLRRLTCRLFEVVSPTGTFEFKFPGGESAKELPPDGAVARLISFRRNEGRATFFEREVSGRLIAIVDAHQRRLSLKHDDRGRLLEVRLVGTSSPTQNEGTDDLLARYRYDESGRLTAHTDRLGHERQYAYDARDQMVRETNRNGYTFHFVYDAKDRVIRTFGDDNAYYTELEYVLGTATRVRKERGQTVLYVFDASSRVTERQDALGGVSKWAYTEEGYTAAYTDAAGACTEYAYDDRGRLIETLEPDGGAVRQAYDEEGRLAETVDPSGRRSEIERTAEGRRVERRQSDGWFHRVEPLGDANGARNAYADGSSWVRRFREDGLVHSDADEGGRTLAYDYDRRGRLVRVVETAPGLAERVEVRTFDGEDRLLTLSVNGTLRARYTYDPEGNCVRTEHGQRTVLRRYASFNRLVEHTDPLGRSTRFEYDLRGNLLRLIGPNAAEWTFERDFEGRVSRVARPDGRVVRYERDASGRITGRVEGGRGALRRKLDAAGRVVSVQRRDGQTAEFEYDAAGRLTSATAPDRVAVRQVFGPSGLPALQVQGEEWVRLTFDAARPRKRSTSTGGSVTFNYGPRGRLDALTDASGERHLFTHDALGRRTGRQLGAGLVEHVQRDAAGRITESSAADGRGRALLRRRLKWRDEGLDSTIESIDEWVSGSVDDRNTHARYTHDAFGRLSSWRQDDGEPQPFKFDDLDNLVAAPGHPKRSFVADGRLTDDESGRRFRHDENGRLVAVDDRESSRCFFYDADDLLVTAHIRSHTGHTGGDRLVRHTYDALGRRVRTVAEHADGYISDERFVWDRDQVVLRLEGLTAEGRPARVEEYVYDPSGGAPLFRMVTEGSKTRRETYFCDQRGAAIALFDDEGRVLWRGLYDPFGRCEEQGPLSGAQPLRLAGQLFDHASGLSFHRHRVYDPASARFLTPDPLGLMGGLNSYAFATDPLSQIDPLGLLIEYAQTNAQGRVAGAQAELSSSDLKPAGSARGPVTVDPPGLNTAHPDHHERSHLIADRSNGDGTDARNIVPLTDGANGDAQGAPGMRGADTQVGNRLRAGDSVTSEVRTVYSGTSPVPSAVHITAVDQNGGTIVNSTISNGQLSRHRAPGCS